jgi:hypothetical protein
MSVPTPEPTLTLQPASNPAGVRIAGPIATATGPPMATATAISTPTPPATATVSPTYTLTPTAISQPAIGHVVIVSIDGLRPDALDLADTPALDDLRSRGAYCPNVTTVVMSETLPGHASMLTGMVPEKHGLLWGLPYIGWPGLNGPTLFNVAHDAGLETAMAFGKEKLNYLVLPNSVDKLAGGEVNDAQVKDWALKFIRDGLPGVLFVHFPDSDRVGHAYGWASEHQLQSIAYVDGLIGELVAALEGEGYGDSTLLIVTSDHGGHNLGHGDDSAVDRAVPWLAVGPGVPKGVTLGGGINIYDTAATALYALGLPIPEVWDGRPVMEIFQ